MKYCIPDELFNLIPYPITGTEQSNIDGILREIYYKMPKAADVIVKRETWHSLCDFCARTGALLEKLTSTTSQVAIAPTYGNFLRVVGAFKGTDATPTSDFELKIASNTGNLVADFGDDASNVGVVISVGPKFSDNYEAVTGSGWTPRVPKYLVDRYGECIMHGALMRLFAMTKEAWGDLNLARMHAVSYNNDLNRLSFGLITSGMRKHLLIDVEDFLIQAGNGNG